MKALSSKNSGDSSKAIFNLDAHRLAVSNGNLTKSFDLRDLVQVRLHSGAYFAPDTYELSFKSEILTCSSEAKGAHQLYHYLTNLRGADLDAAQTFIRCPDDQVFDLWSAS